MCASWHLITKEIDPIQSLQHLYVMKYQNASILIRTIPSNQKYCQMAYMLFNDNIKIFLITNFFVW